MTVAALVIVGNLTGMRREEQVGPEKVLPQSQPASRLLEVNLENIVKR